MFMIIKPRYESLELKLLRYLNNRMELTEKEKIYYSNLEKGLIGERMFDEWLEQLPSNFLVINDLLFECNNTLFQIDSLVISHETIFLFEVKNYAGDFIVDNDKWHKLSGSEINNPIHQLKRTKTLLRKLLQQHGLNPTIEIYVVFINPEFYLYQAPIDLPIIFPTQIKRFIDKVKLKQVKLKDNDLKLAKQLVSMNSVDSPYKRIHTYSYEQLKKGITCISCHSLNTYYTDHMVVCKDCAQIEIVKTAILRSVAEFQTLFPEISITTKSVYEWCKIINSKKTIRRVLSQNLKQIGQGKSSYFIYKSDSI